MDLSQVQAQSFEVLPKGRYLASVTKTEIKPSKTGGEYLSVEFTVMTEGQKGRKVWDIFTTKNANPKAVQVALGRLKTLSLATGITEAALVNFQPAMLAGRQVVITTDVKTDSYGDKATVKKFEPSAAVALTNTVNNALNTQSEIPF